MSLRKRKRESKNESEYDFLSELEHQGHSCMKWHFQETVQWCGSGKCLGRSTLCQTLTMEALAESQCDSLFLVTHTDCIGRKSGEYLMQMKYDNWMMLDSGERFRTWFECIRGYECHLCHSRSSFTNPIYGNTNSQTHLRICSSCAWRLLHPFKHGFVNTNDTNGTTIPLFELSTVRIFGILWSVLDGLSFPTALVAVCQNYVYEETFCQK